MTKHVLVVDDHAPWRQHLHSLLLGATGWEICGEASDGGEAIQQAKTCRPDVILLDIELPTLNGIEAANAILASNSRSKILFVSAHRSWDIVDAALSTGARGYVLKTWVAEELLPAMETVAAGGRFISAALTGRAIDTAQRPRNRCLSRSHVAGFYSDGELLLDEYARSVGNVLDAGSVAVYIADESRRSAVLRRLEARRLNVDLAIREGRLRSTDVVEWMATFMVDGWPDEARFWRSAHLLISGVRSRFAEQHPGVAVCGDGAGSLLRDDRIEAAIRLEQLWDDFARTYNLDVFCGYSGTLDREDATGVFQRICAAHSAVHSR